MSDEAKCPECNGFRALPRMLHDQEEPRECSHAFHKEMPAVIEFPTPAAPEGQATETPAPVEPAPTIQKPVCPHCGVEGKIRGSLTTLGPIQVMIVSCGNPDCRKIFSAFQPLSMQTVAPPGMAN